MTCSSSEEDTASCEIEALHGLDVLSKLDAPAKLGLPHELIPYRDGGDIARGQSCPLAPGRLQGGGQATYCPSPREAPNSCLPTHPSKAKRWAGWIGGGDNGRLLDQLSKKTGHERKEGVSDKYTSNS